ncbi:hypothetical protein BDN72DRAFT_845168 [Pluteus cervinus]|uniref:Uncharacterized protein n=1 Tax=Pluteus cervinus TaxID=181527 RepID=A0ACD3AJT8_9AGAR|nr:hypothetical protein BDN72DRAFT_845168 [Pluteus cervinus]
MSDPVFPPEIEYVIFMGAFSIKEIGESAVNLVLVARRVHLWLIPKLTETFATRTFRPAQKYPASWDVDILSKYGIHTKHLFIWISPLPSSPYYDPLAAEYISLCPNLTDLVLWSAHSTDISSDQLDQLAHLQALTHLSINLKRIPSSAWENPELVRLFKKITHLHSVAHFSCKEDIDMFERFTSITHLTFYPNNESLVALLLTKLPASLEVLVILEGHYADIDRISTDKPSVGDSRVINIACQADKQLDEWLLDVQKGQGIWGLADQAVRERKKIQEGLDLRKEID